MSSPKTQTVTTKNEPWSQAKPYYEDLYKKAQEAFGQTNQQMYTGDLWAAPTETQIKANQQLANNQWGTGATELRNLGMDTVSGKYLDPSTNPWIAKSVDAALGDVSRRYTQDILPGLGDAAIRSGAYGGSRQGIQEGLAAGEYARETSDAATRAYTQNYENERQRQMQGGQFFNQANALEMAQLQGLTGAGAQEQQWNQMQNNENYQRYQMQQAAPWIGLPELSSILTGGGFQSSAQTGPNPNYTNPMQTVMGLGSMIAGLGNAFQPAGGWGASMWGGGGAAQPPVIGNDPWAGMRNVTV